jgi:uncharacterized protein (DUF1499 family)
MAQKLKRILVIVPLVAVLILAGAIIGVRIAVRTADTGFVDFTELKRSPSGNDALACPPAFCSVKADLLLAPVALSAKDLAAKVKQLTALEPRTTLAAENAADFRFVLVQRSALFNFPDTINIAIQPLDASHSAIAVYSRSRYGKGDLGVNMKRLQRWLTLLGVGVVG